MAPGAVLEGSFIWAKARSGEAIIRPSRQGKSARIWKFLRRDRIGVVVTSKPQCFRQKKAVNPASGRLGAPLTPRVHLTRDRGFLLMSYARLVSTRKGAEREPCGGAYSQS